MTKEPKYTRLMLCVNFRSGTLLPSCGARGSREIAKLLRAGIAERNIPLEFEPLHCMGKCHIGPTMRLAPGGPFFMGTSVEDVPHVLDMLEAGKYDELADEFPLAEMDEFD